MADYAPFGIPPPAPQDDAPAAFPPDAMALILSHAQGLLGSQNLRDPAVFDPATYAPTDPIISADQMASRQRGLGRGMFDMVRGAYETIPRAMQAAANYQPGVPETYDPAPAANAAMNLAGMGAPAAEAGAAGIFGGKLSKLADHAAIAKAEQMQAEGHGLSKIWDETGTARGADGQWRQEIDDSAAKLKMQPSELKGIDIDPSKVNRDGGFDHTAYLDDVLHHPELYRAYPHLKDVSVTPLWGDAAKNTNGDYSAHTNTIRMNKNLSPEDFKSTLLHEVQHAVQTKEGFAPGDSPAANLPPALGPAQKNFEAVRADMQAEIAKTYNTNPVGIEYMKDLIRRDKYGADAAKQNISKPFEEVFRGILNRNPDVARRLGNIVDSEKLIDDAHATAFEKYRAGMGEVESRSVQDRMNMSPDDRAGIHPIYNEEIPRSQQRDPRVGGASSDDAPSAPAASAAPPSIRETKIAKIERARSDGELARYESETMVGPKRMAQLMVQKPVGYDAELTYADGRWGWTPIKGKPSGPTSQGWTREHLKDEDWPAPDLDILKKYGLAGGSVGALAGGKREDGT